MPSLADTPIDIMLLGRQVDVLKINRLDAIGDAVAGPGFIVFLGIEFIIAETITWRHVKQWVFT